MNLPHRISILSQLGKFILSEDKEWAEARERAGQENGWFTLDFIQQSLQHIAHHWLQEEALTKWTAASGIPDEQKHPKRVGIVMAGNIPLVGFHDWLCVFISGHHSMVKPSSKDKVLFSFLLSKLASWYPEISLDHSIEERLKGCDAYIATGSNNSSRYFEYYFNKYPHIIRRNRTSVAILTGKESATELSALADDVHLYFGLGCRNVTKIYVPVNYDFIPLLDAFKKYAHLSENHKYKNNYDYTLALHILNNKYYMTNGTILLVEEGSLFAPLSQLNFEYYSDAAALKQGLLANQELQCIVGWGGIPLGSGQQPSLNDYPDGIDTLDFLNKKMLN